MLLKGYWVVWYVVWYGSGSERRSVRSGKGGKSCSVEKSREKKGKTGSLTTTCQSLQEALQSFLERLKLVYSLSRVLDLSSLALRFWLLPLSRSHRSFPLR